MEGSTMVRRWIRLGSLGAAALLVGCQGTQVWQKNPVTGERSGTEASIVQASFAEKLPGSETSPDMQEAEEAYRAEQFERAERLFHRIVANQNTSPLLAEKARFFEAESLRRQGYLPKAADTYSKMLQDFPSGVHRQEAVIRMYDIANFWLEDTRRQMEQEQEKREGKRWFVPSNLVHWDRSKPLVDEEGRALELLEKVHVYDPQGPVSDKALFLAGYTHFYRGNFNEADQLLSQLIDLFPNSSLRPQCIEMAIMAKNNATGGSDYDGRKSAEALKLVSGARASVPELANRGEFLDRQMVAIRFQQADKDMKVADFYRRTGHAASAYFYYEIVRRRYPNTEHARVAVQKMEELRVELDQSQDTSFSSTTKRGFNKYVLGVEPPTLQPGQSVPTVPGQLPEPTIVPTDNTPRSLPNELLPRQ
jgi:outer membrane protein assembly factor BamD (BamD/ComL family)